MAYASSKGCTLLDRELYLPLRWTEDRQRCQEAGIPDDVSFQTKPELAWLMLERLDAAQVPVAWVVADSVYGGNLDLRTWLEVHQYRYVGAVANTEAVGIQTATGRKRLTVAEAEAQMLTTSDWQRLSMNEGTKGPRWFDWAVLPILHRWEDDGQHWLLIRRRLDDPTEKTFYLVFVPKGTTLAEMVKAIGARWSIETCFETGKEMGLEDYEARGFTAWYRFITLVMVVMAALAGICAAARASPTERAPAPTRPSLLPLTIPEVRHLLATLLWPLPRSAILVLSWLWWRRSLRVGPAFFIRNADALLSNNHHLAQSNDHLFSAVVPIPGNLPGVSLDLTRVLRKRGCLHDQSFVY
ncbi:hypothetical protein KSC_109380 [Ktedonobacter sp. SOSP1-52]|nr:hypothetical protein KSC_109380 [Ktedonobacter sp. SOSP1-52]